MENTTSATTKKVKNDMPYDIAFLIMSKLPPKSVKRFGCLSKSWDLNFENPHFMTIFRKNFISNHRSRYADTSLLLNISSKDPPCDSRLYSLLGEKFENKHKLDWPNPFPNDNHFEIWGSYSVNGILCLYRGFEKHVFWNPATKEFKVIPRSPYVPPLCESYPMGFCDGFGFDNVRNDYTLMGFCDGFGFDNDYTLMGFCDGFGFDNVRNDYKLIRHWDSYPPSFEPFWEIYSLRSNSWKKLDGFAPPSRVAHEDGFGAQLYTEGMCHWWGGCIDTTKYDKYSMILSSFDLGNEVFIVTPIIIPGMEVEDDTLLLWSHLTLLNGSIALISYPTSIMCPGGDGSTTFHISVLGELGIKESWTKLFIVGSLPYIARPIGVGKKGDLFFTKVGGDEEEEIVYFDLSTQKTHELGIKTYYHRTLLVYKESFIPIEGINN